MRDNIFSSKGIHVGIVDGRAIFDLNGQKLYDLKGTKIYRLTGELVGHLNAVSGSERRLDRSNDRLFPSARNKREREPNGCLFDLCRDNRLWRVDCCQLQS